MIEFLNARRMIVVIGILILLCIIIMILEDSIADKVEKPTPYLDHVNRILNSSQLELKHSNQTHLHQTNVSSENISLCWKHEQYTVRTKCSPCDMKEMLLPACIETGFKEHLHCKTSGDVFRSCDSNTFLFWGFEFCMLSLCLVFNFYVKNRQNLLNRQILDRIEKQIASGV